MKASIGTSTRANDAPLLARKGLPPSARRVSGIGCVFHLGPGVNEVRLNDPRHPVGRSVSRRPRFLPYFAPSDGEERIHVGPILPIAFCKDY